MIKSRKKVLYICFFPCCTEPVPNWEPQTEVRTKLWLMCTVTPLVRLDIQSRDQDKQVLIQETKLYIKGKEMLRFLNVRNSCIFIITCFFIKRWVKNKFYVFAGGLDVDYIAGGKTRRKRKEGYLGFAALTPRQNHVKISTAFPLKYDKQFH